MDPGSYPPFATLRGCFGFVPNLFHAQTLRPAVLEVEIGAIERLLATPVPLSRERKELILLSVSAANRSAYGAALHAQVLATLGVAEERTDRMAVDPRGAGLPEPDAALVAFARGVAAPTPGAPGPETLLAAGFTRPEALEAAAVTAVGCFLDVLAEGLGTLPDFPLREGLRANLFPVRDRPTTDEAVRPERVRLPDPDAGLVARVKAGDLEAFDGLVRRHERRVYRTAVGITADPAEAEDCAQRAFLKAFQAIGSFEGTSTFATWLTRIAINEALERVRSRRPFDPLEEGPGTEEGFRPRQIRAWTETPEEVFAREELRALVERELLKLPPRYRAAVLLRDLEGLSTQEAAESLGLAVPTLKTHLLRGRLLLREALTPHFAPRAKEAHV